MRVGYIGLGNMGRPMASHLAPSGFETTVFDIDAEAVKAVVETGARAASSPREVGEASEVVCICVQTDDQVRLVLDGDGSGALHGMSPGGVVCVHSTVSPETIDEMHGLAQTRGCSVVDAAVTGGAEGAETKQLVVMAGGEDEVIERVRPVLEAASKLVIHAGPRGYGAKLKLVVNMFTYTHYAAVHEAFALAEAVGIDHEALIAATRGNGQLSDAEMQFLFIARMAHDEALPEAMATAMRRSLALAEKDLSHTLELARKSGVALPTAALVSQGMARIYRVDDSFKR